MEKRALRLSRAPKYMVQESTIVSKFRLVQPCLIGIALVSFGYALTAITTSVVGVFGLGLWY
jgi:hypothetical protein